MASPERPNTISQLENGRLELAKRTRRLVGFLFISAAAAAILATLLPAPDRAVKLPMLALAVVLGLGMSAWYLFAPVVRSRSRPHMLLSGMASAVLALAVYATGGSHSYMDAFFVMVVLYTAVFASPRQLLWVATVVSVASALPLFYDQDPWFIRAMLVRVALYFSAAYFSGTVVGLMVQGQQDRARLVEAALEEASRISLSLDLQKTLEAMVQQLKRVTGADTCVVYLLNQAGDKMVPQVISLDPRYPRGEAEALASSHTARGEGLVGWVWERQEPLLLGDAERDPRAKHVPGTEVEDASYMLVPLTVGERVLGVIRLSRGGLYQFRSRDLRVAAIFANQSAVAIENARLYSEAERLSITDGLTGLYNARYLEARMAEEVARSRRYGHPLALLMMDLDTMKLVNDRFGHLEGNRLLRQFASILTDAVRRADLVIRYAGDEFVVLMPETPAEDARLVAERICGTMAATPFVVGDQQAEVTVSIGVAACEGGKADGESLIRSADTAMYRAKRAGKNQVHAAGTAGSGSE